MLYKNVLEELNFSKKEISVYIALLELDTATVAQVSNNTDINRTSCYDLLQGLIKRGVVSKIKKKNKTYFYAGDPKRLLNYLEREKQDKIKKIDSQQKKVQSIMPELSSILNPQSTKPKVEFFEGKEGMKEAYEDTLTANKEYLAYANIKTMHEGMPGFFPDYYKRRVANKILGRGIFPNNHITLERMGKNKEEMRQSIVLGDKSVNFTPEMIIYNNKVLIVSWIEKMAVTIESKEFAELQRSIFNLLWGALKKDRDNIVSM